MSAAVVRMPDGTVLGPDWRRALGSVPGQVAAEHVEPGDRFAFDGDLVTVLSRAARGPASVSIVVRTPAGGEVVLERYLGDRVDVLQVGAFDV